MARVLETSMEGKTVWSCPCATLTLKKPGYFATHFQVVGGAGGSLTPPPCPKLFEAVNNWHMPFGIIVRIITYLYAAAMHGNEYKIRRWPPSSIFDF